jgi:hypothetical protein
METELKNQGTFQEHYGRFPYIVHRMFAGIYRQIPIVFSHEHEQGELPGVTIRLNTEKHSGLDVIHSEAMRTQLKQVARKVKTDLEQQHNQEARVCLVFGPTDCFYLDATGECDSTRPPVGGTLCNAQGKPMVIAAEPHWRALEYEPIILKRA